MYVPKMVIRPQLEVIAQAPVPTRFGEFEMMVFHWKESAGSTHALSPDHVVLRMGQVEGQEGVLARVHSECLTSEVFGSLKCDCREQLEAAQAEIARRGRGLVIYLRQEGRGIGLANKIRAYQLQSRGHDTVDANRILGLPDDARDYSAAAAVIEYLGVKSIQLMTNNPEKVSALEGLGVLIQARVPSLVGHNPHSAAYLEAKRLRMGHALPELSDSDEVPSGPRSVPFIS